MQISSQNSTILVLGDIHQAADQARKIIEKESADYVVCVGDWFDSYFYDSRLHVENTCRLLREFAHTKNCYTLWGNHDLQYFHTNPLFICSGFEEEKRQLIKNHLPSLTDLFRWYIWIDDRLCTHAGIHHSFLPPFLNVSDRSAVTRWLDEQCSEANSKALVSADHWFWSIGKSRDGQARAGGLVWLDFNREFEPIEGLTQLVGHTSSRVIRKHHLNGNLDFNEGDLCIDCHLNEYLLINNGAVQVKKFADL